MKIKKLKVFITSGFHVDSAESGKYHTLYVADGKYITNSYDLALYQLTADHAYNPNGYMIAIPSMIEETVSYVRSWKIVESYTKQSAFRLISLYTQLAFKSIQWFFVCKLYKKRIQRERLMCLASLLEEQNTLEYRFSPNKVKCLLGIKENTNDIYDEIFFS
jgi:hypothetical protein